MGDEWKMKSLWGDFLRTCRGQGRLTLKRMYRAETPLLWWAPTASVHLLHTLFYHNILLVDARGLEQWWETTLFLINAKSLQTLNYKNINARPIFQDVPTTAAVPWPPGAQRSRAEAPLLLWWAPTAAFVYTLRTYMYHNILLVPANSSSHLYSYIHMYIPKFT